MTEELFREDSYLATCEAKVEAVDGNWVFLDRTVFYPTGGGQPGDTGILRSTTGEYRVVDTSKTNHGIAHVLEEGAAGPGTGEHVTATINWDRRYRLMQMHTCMHVLSYVVPFGVTGGSIRDGSARLDFDAPEPVDKEVIDRELNEVIRTGAKVSKQWITNEELDARQELVKTLSVQPPRGPGRVRLIEIEGLDLQPCGGTHLNAIDEIGPVRVKKIEKKGKRNRRITIVFNGEDGAAA